MRIWAILRTYAREQDLKCSPENSLSDKKSGRKFIRSYLFFNDEEKG